MAMTPGLPLPDLGRVEVLVAGDVMLDRYWSGATRRISAKAPTLLTPNRAEFERAAGVCRSDAELVERGLKLMADCDWSALPNTRGEEGMALLERERAPLHVAAQARGCSTSAARATW